MLSNKKAHVGNFSLEEDFKCFSSLHEDLLTRAHLLLADLTAFQSYLQSQGKQDAVDIRQFRSSVNSETQGLERITHTSSKGDRIFEDETDERDTKRLHALQSSNLPFYEAVWAAAMSCGGVVALGKRTYQERHTGDKSASTNRLRGRLNETACSAEANTFKEIRKISPVIADIIADEGNTWIKVSTITEKRLLFEMAKEGWEGCESGSSEGDPASDVETEMLPVASRHAGGSLKLVKIAKNMMKAAGTTRVRYRHPEVHFILPRICEGRLDAIDGVIGDLRSAGVTVQCAAEPRENMVALNRPIPTTHPFEVAKRFSRMLPQARSVLTPILNIDCTILLALISDISHFRSENLPPAPNGNYYTAITHQIRSEETTPLLQVELFHLLVRRQMRCTCHAARRMREIVQTMGTAAEKTRADILLGEGAYAKLPEIELHRNLKLFSDHDIPVDLCLPLTVVDFDVDTMLADHEPNLATEMMSQVANGLSEINTSVVLYGWSQEIVTITSNRVVAKEIERVICRMLDECEKWNGREISLASVSPPDIWVCGLARSLIGKEKGRREK